MSEAKTPIRAGWHPVRLTSDASDRPNDWAWLHDGEDGEVAVTFEPAEERWRISERDGGAAEEFRPSSLSLEEVMAEAERLFAADTVTAGGA